MTVEVKNLQSGATFEVGANGSIFGREGGPADIRVADASVSKRHARLFNDGGGWLLEDMGSVNGTVVDGSKIAAPIAVRPGLVFQMSKQRFEVVTVDGRGAGRAPVPEPRASGVEQETRTSVRHQGNPLPSELRKDPIPKKKTAGPTPGQQRSLDDDVAPPPEPSAQRAAQRGRAQPPPPEPAPEPAPEPFEAPGEPEPEPRSPGGDDEYEDTGVGGAVAEGVAYFLKTAPSLVFRPLGTVREHIESPPLPGLEKVQLAAALAPALLAMTLVQAITSALVVTLTTGFSVMAFVVGPLVAVVSGVVGALIAGFVSHPILRWLVEKLGGTSDAAGRTSHVAMGLAASAVLTVPTSLALLLAALAAKLSASVSPVFHLIVVVPALMMIVTTPAPLFVQWSWFRAYGVAKWFQTLIMIFAVLGVLGGVAQAGSVVLAGVAAMRASTGSGTLMPTPPSDAPAAPDAPSTPPGTPTPPATPAAPAAGNGGEATAPVPPATPPDTAPSTPPATPPSTPPSTPPVTPPTAASSATAASGEYGDYARKRAAIEAALERDPTLIQRGDVAGLYQRLSRDTWSAEQNAEQKGLVPVGRKGFQRDPGLAAYVEKVKRAEVYGRTRRTVDELARALGVE